MSLQTIVSKMIAANEPESNIAKVIRYHKKDSSKINCKKCDHSWKVADGGNDLYTCHECGYNNNKSSPLKALTEACPPGFIDNNDGKGCVEIAESAGKQKIKINGSYGAGSSDDNSNDKDGDKKNVTLDGSSSTSTTSNSFVCETGYSFVEGKGCVKDEPLEEQVVNKNDFQFDDDGEFGPQNITNEPSIVVEEEKGSSDDLLDNSKNEDKLRSGSLLNETLLGDVLNIDEDLEFNEINQEQILEENLRPALARNSYIRDFDKNALDYRKSERLAFAEQLAAPIQAKYNQNKIQVEIDNEEKISDFLDKSYREAGIGYYKDGQWFVDSSKVDTNSEEFKSKSQQILKEYNDYLNRLVEEYNRQDEELLMMTDKYDEDTRVNDMMIVNREKQNSETYQKAFKQIVENTQADVDAYVDEKLTEEVGEEGSIERAFNKFFDYTVPSLTNTTKLQGERREREKILKLKKEIDQAPDGSTVSYPPARKVNSPGLGGMRTIPAGKTTKENALKLINKSLNSSGEKEFERLLTDAKVQKTLSLFPQTEVFDEEDGLLGTGATGQDVKDLVVEQAFNMGASIATAGLFTGATESASVMRGILSKKAAKNLNISEQKFNSLSAEEQAKAMADVEDWELNSALAVGLGSMALDNLSLVVGGKAVLSKIPTQVYRKLIRQGALTSVAGRQLTKETLTNLAAPVLKATGVEILTESGQEVFQKVGVETGAGGGISAAVNAVFSDPKAWKELVAQTALSTLLLTGGGKIAFSGGKFAWKNAAAYLTSNNFNQSKQEALDIVQEKYNEQEQKLDQLLEDGEIDRSEYNKALEKMQLELDDNFLEIQVTDDILNNLNLKFLSAESKLKIFPLVKSILKNEKRLEELQDVLKELGPKKQGRPTNERKSIEAEIEALKEENVDINNKVFGIKATDLGKNRGKILDDLINTDQTGVFKGKFIERVKTIKDAEKLLEDLGYDISKESSESEISNLLKGDNNAIVLDDKRDGKEGERVAIVVEDNKAKNLANSDKGADFASQNADQHEALHFILDMFTETELKTLREDTIGDIITSKDSNLQTILESALKKEKQYTDGEAKRKKEAEKAGIDFNPNELLVQEFFTALSDSVFEMEVTDLSLPETTLISKIASTISNAIGIKTGNTLDLNNFTNPKNALEFIKSFNNFNKDGKIINKKTELKKAEEIAKKRGISASKRPLTKEELAVEFDKVNKGEISDELAFQAAYAYEPLARATANRMFRNYSEFGESAVNEQLFGDELWIGKGANSLLGLAKSYDPEIGSVGGYFTQYLPERAKAVMQRLIGKSATTGATSIDTKESRQLVDDQDVNIEATNAVEALALPEPLLKLIKNTKLGELGAIASEMAVTKLPKNATDKQKVAARNKAFNNFIKNQIVAPFRKELLKTTKNKDAFQKYINKNWKAVGDVFLDNTEISKIRNENTRDTLEDWQDNGFTQEDILNYFNDPSIAKNTRSDRKNVGLVNAIISAVSDQIRMDFATKNPETTKTFKEKTGIPLAQKSIPSTIIGNPANGTLRYKNLKELLEDNKQVYRTKNQLATIGDVDALELDLAPVLQQIGLGVWGKGKSNFLKPSTRIFSSSLDGGKKFKREKDGKIEFSDTKGKGYEVNKDKPAIKARQDVIAAFDKMIKRLVDNATNAGPLVYDKKGNIVSGQAQLHGLAKNIVLYAPNSAGKNGKEFEVNKPRTIARNPANAAMGRQVWNSLYQAMVSDPKAASTIGWILQNSSMGASSWHRVWAQVEGYSPNPVGKIVTKKDGTKERIFYTYEHAMPAKQAYLALMDAALNKVPFEIAFNAVEANYKIIALDAAEDGKLIRATDPRTGIEYNFKDAMGDPDWNFYTGNHKQRYFNQIIPALFGGVGISPSGISDLNGQNYADKYNINDKGESTLNTIIAPSPNTLASKKARVFDFDDTLAKTDSNVLYTLPDGTQGSLDATQFADQFKDLQDAEAVFDYSEFSQVKNGTEGPLAALAKRFTKADGDRDVFVLTARPADANIAIQEFLKETLDIKIPLENITGLADGKPSAKANWIGQKVIEGYDDIFFADDVAANVEAVGRKLDELGVTKRVQQAKDASNVLASKPSKRYFFEGDSMNQIEAPLSREFNKMLEKTKGVKAGAVYSDARAAKMGGKKGFQAFVPYSAEDFLGLIYPTLGKGDQGNKDLNWWKDNVMTPYNDGMTRFESAKQAAMIEWNQIKDEIKNTPTNLSKESVRDFSNEDAVRVYLWDQKGVVPDGLSKKDISALTKHVKNNPELQNFANQVANLNINGYPDPTKGWLAGTITTDLVNHVNTSTRSEMLENWQDAIDEIYSEDNKNKLRATFGDKYIEALDDILYRMKTGRNRPSGANRITNNWLNWVNDSVGTIMFFNQRSAILQTISSINFINWSDNNPIAAAKAFANQKQYWSDFSELFNSDFLKQRRSGLKTDVNSDEIAQQAAGSTNKVRAGLSWLLKKGFLPTQIADSFAIASGGSTFYRNRINSLIKEGMSEADAKKQAFSDFRDSANESQQSSDPSRISMEQSSSLGRVILAFANTPIQYTRLTKRATQDLIAGRGDWKTNVSKIVYYGAVQNIIFTALQQAMFGMLFADDDDEFQNKRKEDAKFNIVNSTADTFLRGSGVAGAFVAMLKNMALEVKRQSEKSRSDYTKVADKLFTVSPPIDSKFKKLKSAGRAFTYKQELDKMRNRGIALDNPGLMAIAQTISAFGNIPADRVVRKLNNIVESTNNENAIWQRIALAMGWGQWELGITDRKTKKAKSEKDSFKALEKSIKKAVKVRKREIKKEEKNTPIKALEAGVLGEANRDGSIVVAKGLSKSKRKEVIRHEKVHQKEISSGKLDYDEGFVYYGKKKYERKDGNIVHNGKLKQEGDHSLPWEKVAHKH